MIALIAAAATESGLALDFTPGICYDYYLQSAICNLQCSNAATVCGSSEEEETVVVFTANTLPPTLRITRERMPPHEWPAASLGSSAKC